MRAETIPRAASHHAKPLVIRGGPAHTFGSLVSFLALLFLLLGLYVLREAFAHPLDAQALGVLAAATSITLSAMLFYFLLKPMHRHELRSRASRFRRAG